MLKKHFAAWGSLILIACGSVEEMEAGEDGFEEEVIGESSQALQRDYAFSDYYAVVTNTTSDQSKSTGAIRAVNIAPNTNHSSCGLTFVSKHYAVTAAHCVAHLADNAAVEVETYTTSNLNTLSIIFGSSLVSGTWPNWTTGAPLTGNEGYTVTSLTCHVRRRCHSGLNKRTNCPSAVLSYGDADVDIALLQCAGRSSNYYATTTAVDTVSPTKREVETWWFHEILALPKAINPNDPFWVHYGKAPSSSDRNDNFHYRVRHQLLPLRSTSRPRPFNTPVTYKDVSNVGAYTWSDAPLCHGTSGSGVFLKDQNVLVGPYVAGAPTGGLNPSTGLPYNLLCHDVDSTAAGQTLGAHVRAEVTHAFVTNAPEVLADR